MAATDMQEKSAVDDGEAAIGDQRKGSMTEGELETILGYKPELQVCLPGDSVLGPWSIVALTRCLHL